MGRAVDEAALAVVVEVSVYLLGTVRSRKGGGVIRSFPPHNYTHVLWRYSLMPTFEQLSSRLFNTNCSVSSLFLVSINTYLFNQSVTRRLKLG